MSKLTTKVFILLGLINASVAQDVVQSGSCQDIPAVLNFNLDRYLGVWYDIESIASTHQIGTCNTARYFPGITTGTVSVRNSEVRDGILSIVTGTATEQGNAGTGRLQVTFQGSTTPVPYWVLATDYITYALVYSCTNEGTRRRVNSWKLSRQRFLPKEAETQINQKIREVEALQAAVNANPNVYIKRVHTLEACTVTQELGQCQSVTGTPNYNVAAFEGVWYETARYPQANQLGKCNRANYTLIENGLVAVENRQVIYEELSTISGVAVELVGQNGVLQVNLNTATGVRSQNLVVLATDNNNFALLYTCENTGTNTRRVGSWQMRKQYGPLNTEQETIVRNAIEANTALDLAQYYNTSQTPADCFYYPELNPQQVTRIELPGPCDNTISGSASFNAANFAGTWYEVGRYPQPTQTGQCNQANYIVGTNNVVNVLNTQVVNEEWRTISGTATAAPGRPGVLEVTLNTGNPQAQDLYVLDTDYNNYALLYSCRNKPAENGELKREVSSWKLSKQQGGLTAHAEAAINAKISNTQGLRQSYYLPTSQSNDACFHYPELNPQQVARIELPGPCNNAITGYADFDAALFAGTWYEVGRYPQPTQTGQCNRATYTLGANGVVNVLNSQVVSEQLRTISGIATAVPGQPGVLNVTLQTENGPVTQTITVLDTDHVSYAVLYSCQNITGNRRQVGSWKLSKLPGGLTPRAEAYVNAIIRNTQGLNETYYLPTSQANDACFYYPEWTTLPATIELPGPCDSSITGANNFYAQTFAGTWHEIRRYPQPTQAGQCNRAQYTAGTAGVINVENRQVTNQTLAIITGTATTVSGQSGVLQVTLNTGSGPTIQTLYVLDTDNVNYVLLYTCENIAENRRRVGSWQMVKQGGSLTAAGTAAINNRIAATQGLKHEYYQNTNQTDAACFYNPELTTLPATIELPGPCDSSITGANNFNALTFAGNWHEIARYPQPTQAGQCNRAQYTVGTAGVINVENRQVTNQTLDSISGTATAVPGQSGVLQVTLTTGSGQTITQTLYVLDTDNVNYALLYTCDNISENRQRVGSWQMVKQTGSLTAAGTAAINNRIASTQVLRHEYYQNTNQTDAACFYYPEWTTLPATIELPGPCDSSITGANNFNAQTFVGTWHEIARYPQPTQAGQCNRAQYTVGTAGVINVENRQVTNQTLDSISGTATTVAGRPEVLQVTLNTGSGQTTQTLYVLDTDNVNYALLYTCENIAENRRRVGSWQMVKQGGSLTTVGTAAINNRIAATQGLKQEYYQNTNQTDAACFYYPEINVDNNVVISGQCDTTIVGMKDIDYTRFANGTWYHVQRYDTVGNRSCISTQLSEQDGFINVYSVEVIGDEVNRTEGTARLTSPPQGQFSIDWTGSPVNTTITVMDTNYNGYAIAYTCQNNGANERRVGVWLLSRSSVWPQAGVAALQALVNVRDEFTRRDGYFKTIPHYNDCPKPRSSAFLFKSSIIMIFVCTLLQFVW